MSDHCHLVVRTGNTLQNSSLLLMISRSVSITCLNVLCGFLSRFLVFALLRTWSVMSKLSKPTGDRIGDMRGPHPSGPHKVNTAHKQSRPAEDGEPRTLNYVYFTTELNSTYTLSHLQTSKHKEFTLLSTVVSSCTTELGFEPKYKTKLYLFLFPLNLFSGQVY